MVLQPLSFLTHLSLMAASVSFRLVVCENVTMRQRRVVHIGVMCGRQLRLASVDLVQKYMRHRRALRPLLPANW